MDGPSLIENRIGQDTVITEQLALWSRGGSRVIRGNLLLIPIGESMLYVEPVFLEAETGGLPELKRVIVATGDKVAMEPTLAGSIAAIFGTGAPPAGPELPVPEEPVADDIALLVLKYNFENVPTLGQAWKRQLYAAAAALLFKGFDYFVEGISDRNIKAAVEWPEEFYFGLTGFCCCLLGAAYLFHVEMLCFPGCP